MPMLADRQWTPEEIEALPDDGQRHECIDGLHLVTPAPIVPHQLALSRLFESLLGYVRRHAVGELLWSPADIRLLPGALVQPDLFVAQFEAGSRSWRHVRTLVLAVEVLSPGTARYDRGLKRTHYQRAGVEEYWIVDLDARLVERWRPTDERPEIVQETLAWHPTGATEPLHIALGTIFTAVRGDSGAT